MINLFNTSFLDFCYEFIAINFDVEFLRAILPGNIWERSFWERPKSCCFFGVFPS